MISNKNILITGGTNIDFLTSSFANPSLYGPEVMQLQGLVSSGEPIPAPYFDPQDASTVVKVTHLKMDVYQPDQTVDTETARPVFVFVHAGNALPPPLNGSPTGTRTDSSAVEVCKRMARAKSGVLTVCSPNAASAVGISLGANAFSSPVPTPG